MNFDKYADSYDAGWKGTKSARFYDDLIREVEINVGDRVLDVGCGTGTVLGYIASKTDIKGYGLDISEKMLDMISTARRIKDNFHRISSKPLRIW